MFSVQNIIIGVVLLCGAASGAVTAAEEKPVAVTVLHVGTLLSVPGERALSEKSVVIEKDRISRIEDGYVTIAGAKTVNLKDKFVMPGLMDMHVHIQGERSGKEKEEFVELSAEDMAMRSTLFARRTLMAGFTTVRDMGPRVPQALYALKRAVDKGWVLGPRIIAAGGTSVTGSHGDVDGMRHELLAQFTPRTICDGPYGCRKAVRQAVKYGADVIKITATGGVLSDTDTGTGQQMADDEMQEIVRTAHALGRKVAAHAHDAGGINAALRAGVDSIEHGSYADAQSIRLFKEKGAYLVPTLLAGATVVDLAKKGGFSSPDIAAKALRVGSDMAAHFAAAHKAGVKIAFGTDSGVSRHGTNAEEALHMKAAGMSASDILKSATVNAADLAGMSADLGSLEAGKIADIIALDSSPLEDLDTLLHVSFVMKEGRVVKTAGK